MKETAVIFASLIMSLSPNPLMTLVTLSPCASDNVALKPMNAMLESPRLLPAIAAVLFAAIWSEPVPLMFPKILNVPPVARITPESWIAAPSGVANRIRR